MRAILLASSTAATLRGRRSIRHASHGIDAGSLPSGRADHRHGTGDQQPSQILVHLLGYPPHALLASTTRANTHFIECRFEFGARHAAASAILEITEHMCFWIRIVSHRKPPSCHSHLCKSANCTATGNFSTFPSERVADPVPYSVTNRSNPLSSRPGRVDKCATKLRLTAPLGLRTNCWGTLNSAPEQYE